MFDKKALHKYGEVQMISKSVNYNAANYFDFFKSTLEFHSYEFVIELKNLLLIKCFRVFFFIFGPN